MITGKGEQHSIVTTTNSGSEVLPIKGSSDDVATAVSVILEAFIRQHYVVYCFPHLRRWEMSFPGQPISVIVELKTLYLN